MRGQAREIVGHFRSSTVAREQLLQSQQQLGAPLHKLIQEVETRWNSTYEMLDRLYEQRGPVGAVLASLRTDVRAFGAKEYDDIKECLEILAPLKLATVELSSEKVVSGSKIIPMVKMLRHAITTKQHTLTTDMSKTLAAHLITQMTERLSHYESAGQHALATLLDPRFKTMGFVNSTNQQNAIKKLTNECGVVIRQHSQPERTTQPPPSTSDASTSSSGKPTYFDAYSAHMPAYFLTHICTIPGLWDLLDNEVADRRNSHSVSAGATVEVNRYLTEPNIPRSEDPLQYWTRNKTQYPHLYLLARNLLCIPASSVPCERVFSKAGEVVSKKRNRLNPNTVEQIIFLNKNV